MFFRLLLTWCTNKRYLQRSTLFNVSINAAVCQAASPVCVCTMKDASGVSHVTHTMAYLYRLKNEVSSHSIIGHCIHTL